MKKLMLLLVMVGFGLTAQAQADNWVQRAESFTQLYSLATELNDLTDKVTAQGSVVSIATSKGTVSVEQKVDPSKPKDKKHFLYSLLTSNGKTVPLDLQNSEKVIESFHLKLLQLKEKLRENHDADVENILNSLFQ